MIRSAYGNGQSTTTVPQLGVDQQPTDLLRALLGRESAYLARGPRTPAPVPTGYTTGNQLNALAPRMGTAGRPARPDASMRERPVEWGHAASGGRGDPNLFQLITQGPERTINPWTGRGYASSADAARHNALLSYYGMPASQAPSGGTPGQIFESEDPREALLRRQRWEQMDAENAYSGAYDKGADWASLASYGRG